MEKTRLYLIKVVGDDGAVLDSFNVELNKAQLQVLECEKEFVCTLVK